MGHRRKRALEETDWLTNLIVHYYSFVARENRVPYYQRLFQQHDGKRQWWKVSPTTAYHNDRYRIPLTLYMCIDQPLRCYSLALLHLSLGYHCQYVRSKLSSTILCPMLTIYSRSHHIRYDPFDSCKIISICSIKVDTAFS